MLRLKKDIEIKELEKFDFEISHDNNNAIKIFFDKEGFEEDVILSVENRTIWLIENGAKNSNERYFGNPQLDTIFDLISANLIEKF